MNTMDLLRIPGMNGSAKARKMYEESRKRMNEAALNQALAAAMMSVAQNPRKRKAR